MTVPIFQQGGWFDPYSGSHLRSFAAIGDRVPNRVMIGPVVARGGGRDASAATSTSRAALTVIRDHELVFYDRYLKDEDNDWERARRRRSSSCSARTTGTARDEWPLPGTEYTPWHLRAGGELERGAAGAATSRPTATTTTRPTRCRRSAASTRC